MISKLAPIYYYYKKQDSGNVMLENGTGKLVSGLSVTYPGNNFRSCPDSSYRYSSLDKVQYSSRYYYSHDTIRRPINDRRARLPTPTPTTNTRTTPTPLQSIGFAPFQQRINNLHPIAIDRREVERLEVNRVLRLLGNLRVQYGDIFLNRLLLEANEMIRRDRLLREVRENRWGELLNPVNAELTQEEERIFINAIVNDALERRRIHSANQAYRHSNIANPHIFSLPTLGITNAIQAPIDRGVHVVENTYRVQTPILPIPPSIEYFVVEPRLGQYLMSIFLDSYNFPIKLIPNLLPYTIFPNKFAIITSNGNCNWFTNPLSPLMAPIFMLLAGLWLEYDPSVLSKMMWDSGILTFSFVRNALGLNELCTHIENPTAIYESHLAMQDIIAAKGLEDPNLHTLVSTNLLSDLNDVSLENSILLMGSVFVAFIFLMASKDPSIIKETLLIPVPN